MILNSRKYNIEFLKERFYRSKTEPSIVLNDIFYILTLKVETVIFMSKVDYQFKKSGIKEVSKGRMNI